MIDVRKLHRWRRADLEVMIFDRFGRGGLPGNIAGDIVLGSKSVANSIRFSVEQHDPPGNPFVTLSAANHTRCTDAEVNRFMKFVGLHVTKEITSGVNFARSFRVQPRR